jgi:adenylylsulfate kinase
MAERQSLSESMTPGFVVWLTGLPASGKTALAHELRRKLSARGIHSVIIDSDELRRVLTPAPSYSPEERDWFYGTVVYLAQWLAESGVNVLIAATAHRRNYRDAARRHIRCFAEVYVSCSLEVCRRRDPKGLYTRAALKEIHTMPGDGSEFEAPLNPEVIIDTGRLTPEQAADFVLMKLDLASLLPR